MVILQIFGLRVSIIFLVLAFNASQSECNAFVEDMACGSVYSRDNFTGDIFKLKDFDQVVNLKRNYRTSWAGWQNTGSIRVEENCSVTIRAETYFRGTCLSLPEGDYRAIQLLSRIRSVNCTCQRECKCEDVFIPKNSRTCGRAYLGDGCNKCNSEYIQLFETQVKNFPNESINSVSAITLRKGCTLTVFSEMDAKGESETFHDTVVENFNGTMASYRADCDDSAYVHLKPKRPSSRIQTSNESRVSLNLISTIDSNGNPPDILVSIKSLFSGKSHKNAYILLLGADNPSVIGLHGCPTVYYGHIGECHISVELDEFENINAQIRVIYLDVFYYNGYILDWRSANAARLSSLDFYLSKHEELEDAVPNAVVVVHKITGSYSYWNSDGDRFQRKMWILNFFLIETLGTTYTNIIYVLDDGRLGNNEIVFDNTREYETLIGSFEEAINKNFYFNQPLVFSVVVGGYMSQRKVNGYWKMASQDYAPKNLQEQLMWFAEKSGDPLGHAIFKYAFPEERALKVVRAYSEIVNSTSPKNNTYLKLFNDPPAVNRSRILQSEEKPLKFRELVLSRVCEPSKEQQKVESWKIHLEEEIQSLKKQVERLQKEEIEKFGKVERQVGICLKSCQYGEATETTGTPENLSTPYSNY